MKNNYTYNIILIITILILSILLYLSNVNIIPTEYIPIACLISLSILNFSKYIILNNSSNKDKIQMKRCKNGVLIYAFATLILLIIVFIF
ncbi:MAG: hypothetical protein RR745_05770 [Bacilli bacterium]